jgi:NADH:ubiquinone oxidoreductase subunit 4 (subunit M)
MKFFTFQRFKLADILNFLVFIFIFYIVTSFFLLTNILNLVYFIFYFLIESSHLIFSFILVLLILGFLKIVFMENHKLFELKKYSIFFCMNLMSFFYFYFFKVSNLYTLYFISYSVSWYGNILNIDYNLGLDKLGFLFILLTLFLIPICLIISWRNIYYNTKQFFLLFLVLEILLINVFCAIDLILFYIAFETILIPMYFLIGYWGSRERRMHAAFQFFLYTLGGSLFMLTALIFCHLNFGSTNLHVLTNIIFSPYREVIIWLCFFLAFAVKIPMMPVHIWLPEAHVESATGGSVALAGILLKLGTYGILRFLITILPF